MSEYTGFSDEARKAQKAHFVKLAQSNESGRVCTSCGQFKKWEQYHKAAVRKGGVRGINGRVSACKDCTRDKKRTRAYTIEPGQYQLILEKQNGVCAICGKPETTTGRGGSVKKLAVDHSHTTGKVRGLLCARCNVKIGGFDSLEDLIPIIRYLRETQ